VRRSKKDIKAAIEQLKAKDNNQSSPTVNPAKNVEVDSSKKSSMRIRKQGI
jgi:hypothetical protein